MIDLHTHILPGLDDGAEVMAESLAMAELALEGGTNIIVATPHSNQSGRYENYCSDALTKAFDAFERALAENYLPLKVYRGMEIYASWDMDEKIADGRLSGIGDSDYYLIEFPFDIDADSMGSMLESVLSIGKIPVIAHPERYGCVQYYPGVLYEWMMMGCLSQINKGSVFGRFGRGAAKTAEILLAFNLVTCIASDAHSADMRTTYMGDIRDALEERMDPEYVRALLYEQPKMILENRKIAFLGSPPVRRRRIFR